MAKKGRSIFISYKYDDEDVHGVEQNSRTYATVLQKQLKREGHVNKGEPDGLDLSELEEETIHQKLKDRMFPSTVTIVLISPNMVENGKSEEEQWIPREVRYSLRTENREAGKSGPNAMIAVVLPDAHLSYKYYMEEDICSSCNACNARMLKTSILFPILRKNMFNAHGLEYSDCRCNHPDDLTYTEEHSYIHSVKWDDFRYNSKEHIERALERRRNLDDYELHKTLE